jgi:hypothetical protein
MIVVNIYYKDKEGLANSKDYDGFGEVDFIEAIKLAIEKVMIEDSMAVVKVIHAYEVKQ